jgi:hypothetical protein
MKTSSKKTEPRPTGLVPMSSKCVRVMPFWLRSTKKALTPRAPSSTLPVRAKMTAASHWSEKLIEVFSPLSR